MQMPSSASAARGATDGEHRWPPPPASPPAPPATPLTLLLAGSVAAAAGLGFGAQLAALLVPGHWCRDARADSLQAQLPLDLDEVLEFTVPTRRRPQGLSFSQCRRYEGDMAAAYLKWITTRNRPHQANSSQPTIPCDQGWHYNFTGGFPTISTDLNWVCSDGWKPYVVHFMFFISAIVGIYLWSFFARRWGRLWALLGALGAGLAGAVATLPPAAHLAPVLAARAAAGSAFLAAPHLALRLVARGELRGVGAGGDSAAAAGAATAWAAVAQSAAALAAACAALFVPWWWVCAAAAAAATFPAILVCWLIFKSYTSTAEKSTSISFGLPLMPEGHLAMHSIVQNFVSMCASTAYFGQWLLAPQLLSGPALRSGALLALAECTAWPLVLLLWLSPAGGGASGGGASASGEGEGEAAAGAGGDGAEELRSGVASAALAAAGVLLAVLGALPDADVSTLLTAALVARAAAAVAFGCGRAAPAPPPRPGRPEALAGGAPADAHAMLGLGAAVAVLLAWLGEETNVYVALLAMGTIATLGATCAAWDSGRPLFRRVNYCYSYVKTSFKSTIANCAQEGSAKFRNSNIPYGNLQNV